MWGGFTACAIYDIMFPLHSGRTCSSWPRTCYISSQIFFCCVSLGESKLYVIHQKEKKIKICSLYIKDSGLHFGEVGVIGACILARKLAFIKLNI